MTKTTISMATLTDQFKNGKAKEVFDEVDEIGTKIVLQDDIPSCILISPKQYQKILEALEDNRLYSEAEQRSKSNTTEHSHEEVCSYFNITDEDLANIEVEIE